MQIFMDKKFFGILTTLFFIIVFCPFAQAFTYTNLNDMSLVKYDDAWNISPVNTLSNQIDDASPWYWSYPAYGDFAPNRMFGYFSNFIDWNHNTIFSDGTGIRFVEWHTATDITLYGANLFAGMDWNGGDIGRAFSTFRLYYSIDNGATWTNLVDFNTEAGINNKGNYTVDIGDFAKGLAAGFAFDPVTARYFRAEFTPFNSSGLRVTELDAITSPAPIPGGVLLLASGLVTLVALRKKFSA